MTHIPEKAVLLDQGRDMYLQDKETFKEREECFFSLPQVKKNAVLLSLHQS